MRRRILGLTLLTLVLLLAVAAPPASAQGRRSRGPVQLYLDLGYVNLFSYPKWFNIGPELELRLGPLSVNPDVSLWVGQTFNRKVRVVPGLTANLKLRRLVLGGGVVYRVSDWPESGIDGETDHGWLMPKAQIGYALGPVRATFYLLFPGGQDEIAAGLTLGMGLGRPSRD